MMEKSAAPWPLLQIAIEPKSRADQEKLLVASSKLAPDDRDPSAAMAMAR
ncbi:hypothetical protein NKI88_08980 [Mesorhizobium sp. M0317]